ncbi:linear amide C-N hydrolase [Jonesia denitrificans]|uniref:linear amide C-N hydrolase n=1 Tax=Jonesia denitrificans TaxID=43674 RepID=UPI001D01AC06|nr:linear amide C-N hydrolase [Jonesia denitrificans]
MAQQRGCVLVEDDSKYEITIYSSCCNTDRGIYYYRTYENSQLSAVDIHREDLDSDALVTFPLITGQQIHRQN